MDPAPCRFKVESFKDGKIDIVAIENLLYTKFSKQYQKYVLKSYSCINEGGLKPVYRVSIAAKSDVPLKCQPGDTISIFATNSNEEVEWLLQQMDDSISEDESVLISRTVCQKPPSLNEPPVNICITPRIILTNFLELHTLASRKTINILANTVKYESNQANNKKQCDLLRKLCCKEGLTLYNSLIKSNCLTVMDVLSTFTVCRPSLSVMLDLFQPLQPRPYSLINYSSAYDTRPIEFAFSSIDFSDFKESICDVEGVHLKRYNRKTGVCTNWLQRAWNNFQKNHTEPCVTAFLRINLNNFIHPSVNQSLDKNCPLIMISAGTGISPFIGFLQYRRHLMNQGIIFGPTWLIFGCRDPLFDLLFRNEMNEFLEDGTLTHLCLSFSRSSEGLNAAHIIPKSNIQNACIPPNCKYVQDCIMSMVDVSPSSDISNQLAQLNVSKSEHRSHFRELARLTVNDGAHIRVCGDAKGMAPAVANAWTSILARHLADASDNDLATLKEDQLKTGLDYLKQMRSEKRYVEDVWY